ncbi:MAG: carbon-nitrogen hydrolase family protein [Alphaproteobacteria bacterium]|jgi:deaminated glutathione amidase|nr:carbon-nitrogen hydrolase family protein [Alphaproteobacteria bacterium]
MSGPFTVACVQTTTGRDIAANLDTTGAMVVDAAKAGADFILLPETVNLMELDRTAREEKIAANDGDAGLAGFAALAKETGAWLLVGSMVTPTGGGKAANRSMCIDPDGEVQAHYDKIHMFDVDLGNGEVHKESNAYDAGAQAVTVDLPWGRLGLSVCYDMRFPHLYRGLAKSGADFLAVPSAFTRPTGEAHWHVLLRARAIENGCFVFAPAQCGVHENGRKTFGHSLIIDPWGRVLADGGDEPGFISAEIDPAEVAAVRSKIPALTHDRDIS